MTTVTLFTGRSGADCLEQEWTPSLITDPPVKRSKGLLPMLQFSRLGDQRSEKNSLRTVENILAITGTVAEHDRGDVTMEEAHALLEAVGIEGYFHTTPSHTEDAPRWRLLLPFEGEYEGDGQTYRQIGRAVAKKLSGVLNGAIAPESCRPGQSWYYGKICDHENYRVLVSEGLPLDRSLDLENLEPPTADLVPIRTEARQLDSNVALVKHYLQYVLADEYQRWIEVGMAIKEELGDSGLAVWEEWSATADGYDGSDCGAKWQSFETGEGGITFGSVIHWARGAGAVDYKSVMPVPAGTDPVIAAVMTKPTHHTLALAFALEHKGRWVYCAGIGWHRWTGTHWARDELGAINHEVRMLIARYNPEQKTHLGSASTVDGTLKLLRTQPGIAQSYDMLDRDNYLLNTPSGTIDLRTDEICDHRPEDLITRITAVDPDETPGAGARFTKFVDEITDRDAQLAHFLMVALGACLSGAVESHWLLFLIGTGRNGKSTLIDTLAWLLGDYATHGNADALASKSNEHKTSRMVGISRRIVVCNELEEGMYWSESVLKSMTGDDRIVARYMYQDEVAYRRTFKFIIAGNYRPQIRNADVAIKSRLKIVPFNVSFAGHEEPDLPQKLRDEGGAILEWLLQGHRMWLEAGRELPTCAMIDEEQRDYFASQSTVETFIEECCERQTPEGAALKYWTPSGQLFRAYQRWKEERGEYPMSLQRFSEQLRTRYERKTLSGTSRYVGLRLNRYGNLLA